MSLLNSFTTVLYLAISVGLMSLSGYGVTRLCLRDEDKTLRWAITPCAGLALWVALIENLGFLRLGTLKSAPLALLGLSIFAIAVRRSSGISQSTVRRRGPI